MRPVFRCPGSWRCLHTVGLVQGAHSTADIKRVANSVNIWTELLFISENINQMEMNFFLALLAAVFRHSEGYAILNSVSWAVSNDVEGELEANSNEEAAPALLVDAGSIWKQAFPASVYENDAEKPIEPLLQTKDLKRASAAPRMFSYRLDGMKRTAGAPPPPEEIAKAARYMAHYSDWGFLATISTLDMVHIVFILCAFPLSPFCCLLGKLLAAEICVHGFLFCIHQLCASQMRNMCH